MASGPSGVGWDISFNHYFSGCYRRGCWLGFIFVYDTAGCGEGYGVGAQQRPSACSTERFISCSYSGPGWRSSVAAQSSSASWRFYGSASERPSDA